MSTLRPFRPATNRLWVAALAALSTLPATAAADIIDTLLLGNPASEQAHALQEAASERITGGLGEPARRLLPLSPASYNGGQVSFKVKVDPERQNYVTVKLWGSDKGEKQGRLLLYINDRWQVGYRHEGDHDVLNQADAAPIHQGRFLYQTVALPLTHTRGKQEVQLKIAAIGTMWPYGQSFEQKQKRLDAPSRGIYGLYTHTSTRFELPADEKLGAAPPDRIRPPMDGAAVLQQMRATVERRLSRLMNNEDPIRPGAKGSEQRLLLLAEAYRTPWTVAYRSPAAMSAFIAAADAFVAPGWIGPMWFGAGPLGEALARIGKDPLLDQALDQEIEVPVELPFLPVVRRPNINADAIHVVPSLSGQKLRMTRREAWSRFLHASAEWNRTYGRRSYTNQSMIVDFGIYTANRGVAAIAPKLAMPEDKALRYLHEAAGILPWTGNDLPDGGSDKPYGANYHLVSSKGLSRELGWVGTYGETILTFTRDMAELTGDPKLRAQLLKLQTQRLYFRYPALDEDGYRTMRLPGEIDNRTAHFPLTDAAYNSPGVREDWWMAVPAFLKDPVSVGAAQQMLADNQYFPRLSRRANDADTLGMMRNIDQFDVVKALPPTGVRIPSSPDQPDYIFADEENGVLALKQGQRHLFVNFYYRQEHGVSGATRILEVAPEAMRIATVLSRFEVESSGQTWTRPDVVDFLRLGGFTPPGEDIHQAWAGEKLPIAKRPADARLPAYGNWGPFVGKASYYQIRYGRYLIAMNTTAEKTFTVQVEKPFTGTAKELVSGARVNLDRPLAVPPRSTVVLDLE